MFFGVMRMRCPIAASHGIRGGRGIVAVEGFGCRCIVFMIAIVTVRMAMVIAMRVVMIGIGMGVGRAFVMLMPMLAAGSQTRCRKHGNQKVGRELHGPSFIRWSSM
jgi:hypothetical protein